MCHTDSRWILCRLSLCEACRGIEPMEKKMNKKEKTITKKTPSTSSSKRKSCAKSSGIKKDYLPSKNVCKVTFRLPGCAASGARSVHIVGEFNNWAIHTNPMKRLKNGDYAIALELEPGREYQFRYLIDESIWENDHQADRYIKSPYGDCDNSVVVV
jgi:1,4-alpha-glucan branching enzyme